jgi:DNA-binding response OmpR family regulator
MAKILLVDDEPASLEVLGLFLRSRRHDVAMSTTGRGALDLARSNSPDLLIADYFLLDDYDGGAVARKLREQMPRLPVLIVSGMMLDDVRAAVDDIADIRLMSKPLDLREVEAVVTELTPCNANGANGANGAREHDRREHDRREHERREHDRKIPSAAS